MKCRLLGKAKLQSIQLLLFGPKNSQPLVKGIYSSITIRCIYSLTIGSQAGKINQIQKIVNGRLTFVA